MRKVAEKRYRKSADLFLDHDSDSAGAGGGFTNFFRILDGDKETGICIVETGMLKMPHSEKRTVTFRGKDYPSIREAIFAYEDSHAQAPAAAGDRTTGEPPAPSSPPTAKGET